MPILTPNDLKLKLPEMFKVRQAFDTQQIDDVAGRLQTQLAQKEIIEIIKRSKKVAVAVGSRGIAGISEITSTLISFLKQFDAEICIIPAMGSHGDATAEGQAGILERYGISEQTMGVPVRSSLEVVKIGETQSGIPVLFDKIATESDLIIPINRIKPHTDYSGVIESGLCKILAIGLGNHEGCSRLHKEGFTDFMDNIYCFLFWCKNLHWINLLRRLYSF